MEQKKISLFELFFTFAKVGAMTFGGGYAMLPIIERELIEKKKWLTSQELMDFFAVSQVTPGVIAVNTASLLGYRKRKVLGAVAATLGVIFPSVAIITILAIFLKQYLNAETATKIFNAVRICVAALIVKALFPFFKKAVVNVFTAVLFILSLGIYFAFKVSPVLLVLLCAFAALAKFYFEKRPAR